MSQNSPLQLCRCGCRAKVTESWRASEMSHLLKRVEQADLVQYGLIPEFVGRFPVICSLQVCLRSSSAFEQCAIDWDG